MRRLHAPLLLLGLLFGACLMSAAQWTDRAEYDLVLAIRSEATASKRLALLEQWKAKYPASPQRQERRELFLAAYSSLEDTARMRDVVKEMAGERPDNPIGGYWCSVLVPGSPQSATEFWSVCEKAWAAQKQPGKEQSLLARRAAGWTHWQRGDLLKAEAELTAYLKDEPGSTEISAWLGAVLAKQNQPPKTVLSLWHLARAGSAGSAMLETVYSSYHGAKDGLEELRAAAAKSPLPPDGFNVESAAAIAERRRQEALARNPAADLAFIDLRKRLQAPDGAEHFATMLRDKPLPPMKGLLTKFSTPGKPEELTLSMENPAIEDLIVKLTAPLPADPMTGQMVGFEGIAESFTATPFVLVVRVEPSKVSR